MFVDKYIPTQIRPHVQIYDNLSAILTFNNLLKGNNKFYLIQLLEYKYNNIITYFLYSRFGRISLSSGEIDIDCYIDKDKAIEKFFSIFYEKTGIKWTEKNLDDNYIIGKYIYTDMKEIEEDARSDEGPKRILDVKVDYFIDIIYNSGKDFVKISSELGFDAINKPLGSISKTQIKKAANVLNKINTEINTPIEDGKEKERDIILIDLTSEFYSIIPTYIKSTKTINIIKTKEDIDNKYKLLDILSNSSILYKNNLNNIDNNIHDKYLKLNSDIREIPYDSTEYKTLETYFYLNQGSTHDYYKYIDIDRIYEINRLDETSFKTTENSYLLWHGTNIINSVGIITSGLQIFDKAANGSMFGRGIYFANCSSKSLGYIGYNSVYKHFIIFLCEVIIDNKLEISNYASYSKTKLSKDVVTIGLGQWTPNKASFIKHYNITIPMGKLINSGISPIPSLIYDEYVVYDTSRIKIRYALLLKNKVHMGGN